MKKFLSLTIIALVALIALTTSVSAAEVSSQAELEAALAGTDETITLKGNVALTKSVEVGRTVTIDLKEFSITADNTMTDDSLIIVLHGGALTIKGNGSISATNSNASARIAVKMTKAGCDTSKQAKLVLNEGTLEGTDFGISGNGNKDRINTAITINGGTVKGGATGIYHPQEGTLTVNEGTIEGSTGIEMRSGTLTVNGGTIIGTGAPTDVTPNGNGTTTDGAGIAIAQHTTEKNISVVVEDGNIQGYSALYESNPQSNDTVDKVSIEIKGGNFEAINGGTVAVYSQDKTNFITGGVFNSDISKYVDTEKLSIVKDEEGNSVVGKLYSIEVEEAKNGKVVASKQSAMKGEEIEVTVTPDKGYKLKSLNVITAADSKVEVKDGKFIMPELGVIVTAEFVEDIAVPKTIDNVTLYFGLVLISTAFLVIAFRKIKQRA